MHVVAIKPPDETWLKHKAVWDACKAAGVPTPEATERFFEGDVPDEDGVTVHLEAPASWKKTKSQLREWRDNGCSGYEVDLADIPEGTKTLRFYVSY